MPENENNKILDHQGRPFHPKLRIFEKFKKKSKVLLIGIAAILTIIASAVSNIEKISSFFISHFPNKNNQPQKIIYVEPISRTNPKGKNINIQYNKEFSDETNNNFRAQHAQTNNDLAVDAVVGMDGEVGPDGAVFNVDLRFANLTDNPLLISAVKITARKVNFVDNFQENQVQWCRAIVTYNYDASLSSLCNDGDFVVEPLSQEIPPKGTDRFILRLFAEPRAALSCKGNEGKEFNEGDGSTYLFDIEIKTSVALIVIKEILAEFISTDPTIFLEECLKIALEGPDLSSKEKLSLKKELEELKNHKRKSDSIKK